MFCGSDARLMVELSTVLMVTPSRSRVVGRSGAGDDYFAEVERVDRQLRSLVDGRSRDESDREKIATCSR